MPAIEVSMELLRRENFTHMVSVANFETESLRQQFLADPELSVVQACREGEAVGIASGLVASGRKTIMAIENLGLFECLDTLRALPCDMAVPLPIFVGYLGRGATAEQILPFTGGMTGHVVLAGAWTEEMLKVAGIRHKVLLPDADEAEVHATVQEALTAQEPFVVLVDRI